MRTLRYEATASYPMGTQEVTDTYDFTGAAGPVDSDWAMLGSSADILTDGDGHAIIDDNTGMYLTDSLSDGTPQSITVKFSLLSTAIAVFVYGDNPQSVVFPANCYYIHSDVVGDTITLVKRVGGTPTQLEQWNEPVANLDEVTLSVADGVITVSRNGTEVGSVEDTDITSGYAGVFTVWEYGQNQLVDDISVTYTVPGAPYETSVKNLYAYNITALRRNRTLLNRFAFIDKDNIAIAPGCNVMVVDGLLTMSSDDQAIISTLAASGVRVFVKTDGSNLGECISYAKQAGLFGIYGGADVIAGFTSITDAGLHAGSSLTNQNVELSLLVLPATKSEATLLTYLPFVANCYPKVRFYHNEDPRHLPGEEGSAVTENVDIPSGTIVETEDGVRFMTTASAQISIGQKYIDVAVAPLDLFQNIDKYEITKTSLTETNIYVSNLYDMLRVNVVADDSGLSDRDVSFINGLAIYADLFMTKADAGEREFKFSEPHIYIGEKILEIDIDNNGASVQTDTGLASWDWTTDRPMRFMNELTSIMEHDAGGDYPISVRTAGTIDNVLKMEYVPYTNDMVMDKYVQFRMEDQGDCWIEVDLSDDGNTIDFLETTKMLDQLPLWMAWKNKGSVGYAMTNIIGNYIHELFGDGGLMEHYHLEDLDLDINGTAVRFYVGYDWKPIIAESILVDGHAIPMAASTDELLFARVPCFYVSDGYAYVVNANDSVITLDVTEELGDVVNLWTAFDEWGLLFNLQRFNTEGLRRFFARIYDVFSTGFGSSKTELEATIRRELSPEGMLEDEFLAEADVSVHDISDSSLYNDGFPGEIAVKAISDQRGLGVHTWGNAHVGRCLFDADGPGHEAQGRAPYIYDTDLSGVDPKYRISGAGPKSDLMIVKGNDALVNPTVRMVLEGTTYQTSYTGRRLLATVAFASTGTDLFLSRNEIQYDITVEATMDGVAVKRYIKGTSISNVNPNAIATGLGYTNTNIEKIQIIYVDRNGDKHAAGTWVDTNGDTVFIDKNPVFTSMSVVNGDALVKTRLEYTDAGDVYSNNAFAAGNYTEDSNSGIGGSDSDVVLEIMVSPFDASTAVASTFNSDVVTRTVMLNDEMIGGELSGSKAYIRTPMIMTPGYVGTPTITATILEVVPFDNLDFVNENAPEGYDYLIGKNVLDDLKSATTLTAEAGNNMWVLEFVPENTTLETSFPYARRLLTPVESSRTVIVPKLADGETRIIELKDQEIPSLDEDAENQQLSIVTDTPGVLAVLNGNKLYVSRNDGDSTYGLYAKRGYYWIGGDESYAYSYDDGTGAGPMSFSVTPSQPVTSLILPKQPAQFSPVRVIVDGVEFKYRFYEDVDGSKSFTADGMPDYDQSFYIDNEAIQLSESTDQEVVIILEPADASGLIDTGITTSPYDTWDNRFFVAISDEDVSDYVMSLVSDTGSVSVDRAAFGCVDMALITARITDVDGNPVEDVEVTWTVSENQSNDPMGDIYPTSLTTGADGRVTAYYSPIEIGSADITAIAGDTSVSIALTSVESSNAADYLTIAAEYPSMLQSGSMFTAKLSVIGENDSISYEVSVIESEGTNNVEGDWPTPYIDRTINLINGKGTLTLWPADMTSEGLYRVMLYTGAGQNKKYHQTLVWRIY